MTDLGRCSVCGETRKPPCRHTYSLDETLFVVSEFDMSTLCGVVRARGRRLTFHSTSFHSASGFRWPRVGERVEVVFNGAGELLSVHGQ